MEIDILSLFPDYFQGPFSESMLKRAQEKGLLEVRQTNIRDFASGKHKKVDDRPFGGGPGMVLMAEPVLKAIRARRRKNSRVIYLTPQGKRLTAKRCAELAKEEHLVLLCGHYEGIDERVMSEVDEEISIGDYVLTSGQAAAIVVVDAVARFVPGVLGHEEAASQDSFEGSLLDCPHYTRPAEFEGERVPDVLLGGAHALIENWRREKRIEKTRLIRPDLIEVRDGDETCCRARNQEAACDCTRSGSLE
ncbi:MAG: tRNA (guanosine(37)-N1)-methyltransferase TrmD [Chlamydiales bacterium]|nr:tRNA (guanosine(37)-N1)-methyltransferase TrmD [Chlamydiales bacterium]